MTVPRKVSETSMEEETKKEAEETSSIGETSSTGECFSVLKYFSIGVCDTFLLGKHLQFWETSSIGKHLLFGKHACLLYLIGEASFIWGND